MCKKSAARDRRSRAGGGPGGDSNPRPRGLQSVLLTMRPTGPGKQGCPLGHLPFHIPVRRGRKDPNSNTRPPGHILGRRLFGLGPPGGWCSSGAVRFEKSSAFLRNVTNLRQKRPQGGSEIFLKGIGSFFPGQKLFFSRAKTFFFRCLKNECQTDTPQRTETRKAKRARTKIAQNFFFYWTKLFF